MPTSVIYMDTQFNRRRHAMRFHSASQLIIHLLIVVVNIKWGFRPQTTPFSSQIKDKIFIFIIDLKSTKADQISSLYAILSTSLSLTLRYNLLCSAWAAPNKPVLMAIHSHRPDLSSSLTYFGK